jgi:hypothetical protein
VKSSLVFGERLSGGLLDLLPPDPNLLAPRETDERVIVQLCADTGSDTWPYRSDPAYKVITIGADIGVENYSPARKVHGVGANPVCVSSQQRSTATPSAAALGSGPTPRTKRTALWGNFNAPEPIYTRWEDVPKLDIYARPGRKPSIAFLHKSAFHKIPEFYESGMPEPTSDMELRSLCSQGFARAFKEANP